MIRKYINIKNIIIIVLIIALIGILNTTYHIEINGITYKQKIFDYLIGRD